jgi:hypothetical protein
MTPGDSRVPVWVEAGTGFKKQYLRNMKDDQIYYCTDVGSDGVTVHQAEGFGGSWGGPEILLTWRLVKARYALMVHVSDIEIPT